MFVLNINLNKKQQRLIDETLRSLMESITISEYMNLGYLKTDFIDYDFFKCALDNKSLKCKWVYKLNCYIKINKLLKGQS